MNCRNLVIAAYSAVLILQSCTKEPADPIIPNQEELITTLHFQLISTDNSDTATFSFSDIDGPGGNNPIIIADALKANTLYNGKLSLLNEQANPPENITIEVKDEAEAHQFFYQPSANLSMDVAYNDADMNGNPIGILTAVQTLNAENGTLTITLRHNPNKFAPGVKQGDITNAGGETDIEITFDVEIL